MLVCNENKTRSSSLDQG